MADSALVVTQTKVIVPRCRTDLLSRPRLLDGFNNRLDKNRLITVTAPAGYGKTSLLVDAAHRTSLPVCWFALDALDNDPHRFVNHFLAAIGEQFPGVAQKSAGVLGDGNLSLPDIIGIVVNAIYRHVPEYFLFVLDDFHVITNPEIIEFVDRFVQFVDENCRLVISSRRLVKFPNVLLLAGRTEVDGFGPHDLAFQAEEIQALFLQNYNCHISPEAAAKLALETEGWITGLLLSTQPGVANRLRQAQISGECVYDYLANQVFEQQPAPVKDFLLLTAWLDEFNADLCRAIFGPTPAAGYSWHTLTQLAVGHNLFVLPVDNRVTWFRYHQLFQEFLQKRLAAENPAKATEILRRLAVFYFENGEWEKAHAFFVRLADSEAVARLIEQAGLQLVRAGRFKTLESWFNTLPQTVRDSRPIVLALNGYTQIMLGQVQHGLTLLIQAETAFESAATLQPSGLVRVLVWRAGAHRLLSHYQFALSDAARGLTLAQNENDLCLMALALKAWGQCLLAVGKTQEGAPALEESLALYKAIGDEENVARLNLETGVANLTLGCYEKANCYFELAHQYYSTTGNATRLADLFSNWGVLHHLTGNLQRAIQQLEQALDFARQSSYARLEAYSLCGLGDIYADLALLDAAGGVYNRAYQVALKTDERFLLIYLDLARASIARKQSEFTFARTLLASARQQLATQSTSHERALYWVEVGLLARAENKLTEAAACLERAINLFDDHGQRVEKSRAYLYLAATEYAGQQKNCAVQHLNSALKLMSGLQTVQPLVVPGQEAEPLLMQACQRKKPDSKLYQFLLEIQKFKADMPEHRRRLRRQISEAPFASPKLVVRMLGSPQIELNDVSVSLAEWSNRQPRELFCYLLSHPQGATKELIGCDLWPECGLRELKVRFKNCVYRLRRVFGDDYLTFEPSTGQYAFNRKMDYECDVELFEWYLNQAKTSQACQEKIRLLQQAIDLYRGPYLAEVGSVWVLSERQRLHHLYIHALLNLAELYLETKNYEQALKNCWQVFRDDPGQEMAYRLAMKIYAAQGDRCAVIKQFKACEAAVREELNAPVSAETRALYAALVH